MLARIERDPLFSRPPLSLTVRVPTTTRMDLHNSAVGRGRDLAYAYMVEAWYFHRQT